MEAKTWGKQTKNNKCAWKTAVAVNFHQLATPKTSHSSFDYWLSAIFM